MKQIQKGMIDIKKILSNLSFFNVLSDVQKAYLEDEVQIIQIEKNETLFNQGETSDYFYVVYSGRMRAFNVDQKGNHRVVGCISHGEPIGEVSLITKSKRVCSINAARQSILLRLKNNFIDKIMSGSPEFTLQLAQYVCERTNSHTVEKAHSNLKLEGVINIAIVSAGPKQYNSAFFKQLCQIISKHHPATVVNQEMLKIFNTDTSEIFNSLLILSKLELQKKILIFECGNELSSFSEFCLDHSDLIIFIGIHNGETILNDVEKHLLDKARRFKDTKKYLLLIHPSIEGYYYNTRQWLKKRKFDFIHHVSSDNNASLNRFARLLTKTAVSIVLSGGGSHGYAHIGVMKALCEFGIEVDAIGGVSMGAVIGGLFARGYDVEDVIRLCKETMKKGVLSGLSGFQLPLSSFVNPKYIKKIWRKLCEDIFIEDLSINYFALATNLSTVKDKVFQRGLLLDAVISSCSLPGLLSPYLIDGNLYIDGGATNTMPVDVMKTLHGGIVIGVNVSRDRAVSISKDIHDFPSSRELIFNRLNPFKPRSKIPRLSEIVSRATVLGNKKKLEEVKKITDLYLEPDLRHINPLGHYKIDETIEIGYRCAIEKLESAMKNGNLPFRG